MTRAGVPRDPSVTAGIGGFATIQTAAPSDGVEVTPIDVRDAGEIERGVAAFARGPNGGLIRSDRHLGGAPSHSDRHAYGPAPIARSLLLAILVTDGGLISYGPDFVDQHRRAAGYVDRILEGEKPADMPVQAPIKYELVVNLRPPRHSASPCRRRCSPAPTR